MSIGSDTCPYQNYNTSVDNIYEVGLQRLGKKPIAVLPVLAPDQVAKRQ